MATGIFAVLDDIAALMDDIALSTKVATKKTASILGDDLAVNAEKATGYLSSRELPVLWKITKGSFLNKLIIVPIAILLKLFIPVAITIALFIGGCYLAYEGVEKIIEFLFHRSKKGHEVIEEAEQEDDAIVVENTKVKSAITTDFILSIEIVIMALAAVIDQSLTVQIITVSVVAVLATIGVYGLVAIIVRMDDMGFKLIKTDHGRKSLLYYIGVGLVHALPIIIKILGVLGTVALVLVSGGIFEHTFHELHTLLPQVPEVLRQALWGLIGGLIMVLLITTVKKIFKKK